MYSTSKSVAGKSKNQKKDRKPGVKAKRREVTDGKEGGRGPFEAQRVKPLS